MTAASREIKAPRLLARAVVLLTFVLVVACSHVAGSPPGEDPEFVDRLASAARDSATNAADLNMIEVANQPLDAVAVFGPYADSNDARATLGFEWDLDTASPWANSEGGAVVVLVRDSRVVAWSAVPSSKVGLLCLHNRSFHLGEAVFRSSLDEGRVPVIFERGDQSCQP